MSTTTTAIKPLIDNNTTYSVGDGGLTTNDFTTADHDKLDAIADSANNYSLPSSVIHQTELSSSTSSTSTTVAANSAAVKTAYDKGNHSHPYLGSTAKAADSDKLDGANLSTSTSLGTSNTLVPTQNAVKAYVDANAGGGDLVDDTTPQLGGDLDTNGKYIKFKDGDRAIFGAGSDLQIYHSGSTSYVTDSGTGNLNLQGSNISLQDSSGFQFIECLDQGFGGSVKIYHGGFYKKLETSSSGITVTGTVTATAFSGSGANLTNLPGGGSTIGSTTYWSGYERNYAYAYYGTNGGPWTTNVPSNGIVVNTEVKGFYNNNYGTWSKQRHKYKTYS